ncbi:MAG: galactose-1-phosphate uridylyltransferase, partial [Thermoplasmata archaeon]
RSTRPNEYPVGRPAPSGVDACPFCEGHESRTPPEVAALRAIGGKPNGPGWRIRAFPNLYPTVARDGPPGGGKGSGLFRRIDALGIHEVIVMSPSHTTGLADLDAASVQELFLFFRDRVRSLESVRSIAASVLFENAGAESGGTLPHPHAQLVATRVVPPRLREESAALRRATPSGARGCLLEAVVRSESDEGTRTISDDRLFTIFTPFASGHPYEVWIVPHRHAGSFADANASEVGALSQRLPDLLRALDSVRPGASYNWYLHGLQAPPGARAGFHWHVELVPRLTRPDGFELGAGIPVNSVPPEIAASELRARLEAGPPSAARKR